MVSWLTRNFLVSRYARIATLSINRPIHTSPIISEMLVRLEFDHADKHFFQVGKSVTVGNFIWTPYTTMLPKQSESYFSVYVECKPIDPTMSFECVASVTTIDREYRGTSRLSYANQTYNEIETKSNKIGAFHNGLVAKGLSIHVNVKSFEVFPPKCFTSPKPNLTDIELIVGDKTFYASKHILAQHSKKFYELIYGGDQPVDRLDIKNVSPEDFLLFLEALYDCEKGVRWSSLENIANLSILFKSSKCFKACEMFLIRQNIGNMNCKYYERNRQEPGIALKYCNQFGFKILLDHLLNTLTARQIGLVLYEKKYLLGEDIEAAITARREKLMMENEKKEVPKTCYDDDGNDEVNTVQPYIDLIDQASIDFSIPRDNLTDIVLSVGDKKCHVSRQILANASAYFYAMFHGNFNEKNADVIELKDMDPNEFEEFLQHVYNPNRNHKVSNIDYLIKLCHFFDASYNLRQCQQYILNSDSFNDAQKIYMARKYHLTYLFDQVVFKYQNMDDLKKLILMEDFDKLDNATIVDFTMKILENHTESDYYYY